MANIKSAKKRILTSAKKAEAVVYEDAARQREYLRLVLQSAERRRKDEAVVIALFYFGSGYLPEGCR